MKTPETATPATNNPIASKRGRPRKHDALTPAQRSSAYRSRQRADGLKEIKCYLGAEHLAYLGALCDIHSVSISDAVALALALQISGGSVPPPSLLLK